MCLRHILGFDARSPCEKLDRLEAGAVRPRKGPLPLLNKLATPIRGVGRDFKMWEGGLTWFV
jgi:hypothetical protein